MPKVSVIIPVYNAREHLEKCLRSVLDQSLSDIEVICVDDGSNDGSRSLLRDFAGADPRISVLTQDNAGAAVARNAALEVVRGEYVAFMDSDDLYPDGDALQRLYDETTRTGADLCGGKMEHLSPDGHVKIVETPPYYGFTTYLYSRKLFTGDGLRFPNYRRFEDPPFLAAAMAKAADVRHVDFPTYRYRVAYRPPQPVFEPSDTTRDFIRGLTDVARISKDAGLSGVYEAVLDFCNGPEMRAIAGQLARKDAVSMALLCRLNAEFSDERLLSPLDDMRRVVLRCSSPVSAFRHAFQLFKSRVGARVPEAVKFWHRPRTGKDCE